MWKALLIVAGLSLSARPLDAAPRDAAPRDGKKVEKSQRGEELRRDVERISKEIYPPPRDPRRR